MRANHARQVSRMPTRDCKAGESAKRQSASCMEGLCVGRASFALLLFFHSSLVLRTTGGAAGEAALVRARSMMRNFHPANLHEYVYSTRSCVRLRGGGACLPVMDENKTQLPTQVADVEDLNVKLHKAATCGRTDKVLKCVSDGAEVDCVNNQQQTALLLASEKGHVETVRALIENGAAKDFVDSKESNALHYAAYNGHLGTIQALAEMGVDVNALNKFGYSPLQYACADGAIEAVEMLLSLGADVHSHDKMRWTALHRAAGAGHLEVVQVAAPKPLSPQNIPSTWVWLAY
jgi:ankyrin repeat protein